MNSWYHSVQSAKKFGGSPEQHYQIHRFLDSSKSVIGDVRHRSIFHHTLGIFLCERIFGTTITVGDTGEGVVRADGTIRYSRPREVPVRLIAELHIMQDLGWIPSPKDWIDNMTLCKWMGGATKEEKKFSEVFGPKRNVPEDHINMDGYEPSSSKPTFNPDGFRSVRQPEPYDDIPSPHTQVKGGFTPSHPPTEAYYDRPAQPAPQFSCPNCGKQFFNQTVMKLHATQQCVDREGRNPE